MRYNDVVIRTKDQLNSMNKELSNALHTAFDARGWVYKSYPLVYQFNKGRDGESMRHEIGDEVGFIENIHFSDGNLIGDVVTLDCIRKSCNFNNTIDNFVISKTTIGDMISYNIEHFIIYDNIIRKQNKIASTQQELVEKKYVAPKEAYTYNPNAGGHIEKMKRDIENAAMASINAIPVGEEHLHGKIRTRKH